MHVSPKFREILRLKKRFLQYYLPWRRDFCNKINKFFITLAKEE